MSNNLVSEKMLIKRLQAGNKSAFEEVIKTYSARVYSMAYRFTRNIQDSEEILQDTFVTVYRKIREFKSKSSLSSWIYRITVNTALMKLRKRRSNKTSLIEDTIPNYRDSELLSDSSFHTNCTDLSTRKRLEDAILSLPQEYRVVFILRDIDGLSTEEVCKILQVTAPAVKSRLHRARMTLRRELRDLMIAQDIQEAA